MTWLEITSSWFQIIRLISLRLLFTVEELSGTVPWMERLVQPDNPDAYDPTLMPSMQLSIRVIYCKALAPLVHFLTAQGAVLQWPQEFDDWVVRWGKEDEHRLPGTQRLIAFMEKVLPQLTARMPYTSAHRTRARTRHPTNHTRPMPLALLMVVALPQFALGDLAPTPRSEVALRHFLAAAGTRAPRSAVTTVSAYGRLPAKACRPLEIDPVFSLHSPRAGWVTYCRHHGTAFQERLDRGRWTNPALLRGYIDIVGSLHTPPLSCYEDLATWMLGEFKACFPTR